MSHIETAHKLVCGPRNVDYGPPRDDFARLAKIWSGLLGQKLQPGADLTAEDCVTLMVALKLNRHQHRKKDDNLVDAHGYLLCLEWIETGFKPTLGEGAV